MSDGDLPSEARPRAGMTPAWAAAFVSVFVLLAVGPPFPPLPSVLLRHPAPSLLMILAGVFGLFHQAAFGQLHRLALPDRVRPALSQTAMIALGVAGLLRTASAQNTLAAVGILLLVAGFVVPRRWWSRVAERRNAG